MDCATTRVAISALLDGETPPDADDLAAHLAGCAGCATWRARATELRDDTARLHAETPDLTGRILATVHEEHLSRHRQQRVATAANRTVLRWAVGVAAVVQLTLAVVALLAATRVGDSTLEHTSREMASFDIAVAVGFLLVALRPEHARAFLPVALVLAASLAVTGSLDVASGLTGLADETAHLIALVQAGLLWSLARSAQRTDVEARQVTT